MSIRIIRKALGLLIVDIFIIIGIFVLQFRTDSSIIEKTGNLQLTFTKNEDIHSDYAIQNKFRMTYNGLNFFFDDQNPVKAYDNKNNERSLVLTGWQKKDNLSYLLNFTDNVTVHLELASDAPNASLAVIGDLPKDISGLSIPYNYSSNMKIQKDDGNRVILNNRKNSWELEAYSLDSGYFNLNKKDYVATYSIYDETQKFTFDTIVNLEIASESVYKQNISIFKNNLISSFKNNTSETNLSEQVVVSYIAAQAENGKYAAALEDIPANLKKSKQRTYLSAPYLNTLEEMNKLLDKAISDYSTKLTDGANSGSLDIFTIHNIANFMYIHNKPETIKKLLQNAAAADVSSIPLAQATGILQVYIDLVSLDSSYAQYLEPALEGCIERITSACAYENNVLTISEKDTFLSVIQAVETGVAVMRYGMISHNETLQKAGYVMVNSYLTENSSYDLRTLANLYSIIAFDNWYYPHFERIRTNDNKLVWAWTCAKGITYDKDSEGSITLTIDFPESLTHYIIFKGIPSFSRIYIYNMAFRTDPRFETYNSSGYVYKHTGETLLLKSRHKTQKELVRLEYYEKSKDAVNEVEKKDDNKVETSKEETSPVVPVEETPVAEVETEQNQTAVAEVPAETEEIVQEETQKETSPVEENSTETKKKKSKFRSKE